MKTARIVVDDVFDEARVLATYDVTQVVKSIPDARWWWRCRCWTIRPDLVTQLAADMRRLGWVVWVQQYKDYQFARATLQKRRAS